MSETESNQRVAVAEKVIEKVETTSERAVKAKKPLCKLNIGEDDQGTLVGTPSGCSRDEFARITARLVSEGMRIESYAEKKA